MKKIILIFLSLILCFSFSTLAEEQVEIPEVSSDYALVYNIETGKYLFEKNADSIIYPASLVKIMTGLIACEYYSERGNADFNVTVSESALQNVEGNKIGLKAGETVSFYDLIVAVMVGSGNDAAYAIAETVAGSLDAFLEMMNARAVEIGASHTTYSNPSGFHSSYMLTTLRDQALICAVASENEMLMEISSLVNYTMPETNMAKKRNFTNQNIIHDPTHWLRHYISNTKGLNVGMTQQAGWCAATVHDNDGLTNIVLVSGGKTQNFEYYYLNDVKSLIDYSSQAYGFTKVLEKGRILHDVEVNLSDDKDRLIITASDNITALLPVGIDVKKEITVKTELLEGDYEAPISEGDVFGTARVYYGDEYLGETYLVALTDVKLSLKLLVLDRIGRFFSNQYVASVVRLIASLVFAFLVGVFIYICIKRRRLRIARMRARARSVSRARKNVTK